MPTASAAKRASADGKVAGDQPILRIGEAIRALRTERGLSLRELSELTGFSISFLSLVERGRSSLALTSLQRVAQALGTTVGSFFPEERETPERPPRPHVARASGGARQLSTGSLRTYRLLSGRGFNHVLEPLLVTVEPSDTVEEPYAHEAEEFAYILAGELLFIVDGVEHRLGPGDSIHLSSTVPHSIHNDTEEAVEALWVLTPRLF
jgi:transcriptional regulator with XRE-family HTH domain